MNLSYDGLAFLKQWEKLALKAYPDPGSKDGRPYTIGYGHTSRSVYLGQRCTEEQAELWLIKDASYAEHAVNSLVKVRLRQHQYDALVSFVFNVGAAAFAASTLLRKLNNRDYIGAAAEFGRWNKNDGKVMAGLTRRRGYEERMFLGTFVGEGLGADGSILGSPAESIGVPTLKLSTGPIGSYASTDAGAEGFLLEGRTTLVSPELGRETTSVAVAADG